MSLKKQAAAGVKWTSISAAANTALQFLRLAILARLLDRESFGLMAMMTVVIGFAQAFQDMGMSNAIIHRKEITRDQLSSLYWLNLFVGMVLFLSVIMLSPWLAMFYEERRIASLMPWVALVFLITPLGQLFHILMQRELQFAQMAAIEITSSLAGFLVAILSAWLNHGIFSLILGQLAAAITAMTLLWLSAQPNWRPQWHFAFSNVRGYLQFGAYQLGERSLNYISWNLDKLLIGKLLGTEALGLYSVAYQLMIRPLSVIGPVITRVAFPVFSTIQNENERLKRGYAQVLRLIAFVSAPVYLGLIAVAEPFVLLFLGARWQPVSDVLPILCILGVFYSISNPIGSLLLAKGKPSIGFWFNAVGLVAYGLAILLGSAWGVRGVAWGVVSGSVCVLFPLEFWVRWRIVRMGPLEFFSAVGPFVGSALVMAMAVSTTSVGLPQTGEVLHLCVLVPLGAMVYLLGIFLVQRPFLNEAYSIARGAL
jgi:O-antigen/teichoic acid export membrane protein